MRGVRSFFGLSSLDIQEGLGKASTPQGVLDTTTTGERNWRITWDTLDRKDKEIVRLQRVKYTPG
jgi:hypothetical protein